MHLERDLTAARSRIAELESKLRAAMREGIDMTPDQKDRLVGRASALGIVVILCSGAWMTGVQGMLPESRETAPTVKPFSARMGCPEWREGLSRSVTIIATEDETGALKGMQCMRVKERGVVRKVS